MAEPLTWGDFTWDEWGSFSWDEWGEFIWDALVLPRVETGHAHITGGNIGQTNV